MNADQQTLILDIYDTVVDPSRWPRVLDALARTVGARGCMLFELDDAGLNVPHLSLGYDPDLVRNYLEVFRDAELADQAVFARHSMDRDAINLISDDVLAPSREALMQRPNARQMREYGIHYRAGALLNKDNPSIGRFSIQFSARHGPITTSERRDLAAMLPHIAKAYELSRPVRQLNRVLGGLSLAIDRLSIGVCLIAADLSIVHENIEFIRQREQTELFRKTPNGRLAMADSRDQTWLDRLSRRAARHGRFGARPRKEGATGGAAERSGMSVEIMPLTSADAFGIERLDGFAIYSFDTTRRADIDLDRVAAVLSLTNSECNLVSLMSEGLTNRAISERRHRSVETVNSQVKTLLSKANCANRTQLIRKVSNIGANFLIG